MEWDPVLFLKVCCIYWYVLTLVHVEGLILCGKYSAIYRCKTTACIQESRGLGRPKKEVQLLCASRGPWSKTLHQPQDTVWELDQSAKNTQASQAKHQDCFLQLILFLFALLLRYIKRANPQCFCFWKVHVAHFFFHERLVGLNPNNRYPINLLGQSSKTCGHHSRTTKHTKVGKVNIFFFTWLQCPHILNTPIQSKMFKPNLPISWLGCSYFSSPFCECSKSIHPFCLFSLIPQ